jgi:hypothetical protein
VTQRVELAPGARPDAETRGLVKARLSLLLGLCGLLAVWILVMPPFAGSDEFDHAYRAAAAARGQWDVDPVAATRGTGAFLKVPTDIVEAARSECQDLKYTKDHDCVGTAAGDDRIVASGAGRYHPLFYAVIGTAAKPFHGTTALYAMRVATALLAAGLVAMAALAAATWARSRWPYLGIAVACTPVAIYSSAVAAPNGVEMMAALALWLSLIGLLVADPRHVRRLALLAGASGAVLATLRPLGPLWCLLILAAVLVAVRAEPGRIRALVRRPAVLAGALLVLVSALQSTVWVLAVHALKLGVEKELHETLGYRFGVAATMVPAWVLQSIAAFPLRNDASHPAVYACYLILFGVVVFLGVRYGTRRSRYAIAVVTVAALLLPYLQTVQSWNTFRAAWQGRYGLPLAMGIVLLAAYALDRSGRDLRGPMRLLLFLLFVVSQTLSASTTLRLERAASPQVDSSTWVQPSMLLTVVLAAASAAVMWWGAFGLGEPAREPREPSHAPD